MSPVDGRLTTLEPGAGGGGLGSHKGASRSHLTGSVGAIFQPAATGTGLKTALALVLFPGSLISAEFEDAVRPVIEQHCARCHNPQLKTANLDLVSLETEQQALDQPGIWLDVKRMLSGGRMPPEGAERPASQAVSRVIAWIDANAATAPISPGRVTARRLNRAEYNNTLHDLLGLDLRLADDFPVDDSGYGFDNIGDVLSVSPVLLEKYLDVAELAAQASILTDLSPPAPTLLRYQQSRADSGVTEARAVGILVDFDPTGRLEVEHDFPATGEYVIRLRSSDRRPSGPDDPTPAETLALFLDGKLVDSMTVQRDGSADGPVNASLRIKGGRHTLTGQFVDSEQRPHNPNRFFEKRLLWADYLEIAGPSDPEPREPPEIHRRLVGCRRDDCAERVLRELAGRAYRRPPTRQEVNRLVGFVKLARKRGGSFEEGMQTALQAILVSPHFLFRIERGEPLREGVRKLTSHELASRLSYFLWSSMPDDELLAAADQGQLDDANGLWSQAVRLVDDPKSRRFIENFVGQWLALRNLDNSRPDPELFPRFDETLRSAMRRETELFFESALREDRSILDLLDARYTFVNERLARHYGIKGVRGREFRRVELSDDRRGGLLGQAAVLTVSSYPTRTSPVLRGLWVLENLLDARPPPPPDGVPLLNESEVGINGTLREQLEQHRANPACAVCHDRMDALGFGLENYDAIGRWRERDGRFRVDSSGELPGGLSFDSPAALRKILRETEGDEFARALIKKMLTYALGRGLERQDAPVVENIHRQLSADGYRFSSLIKSIVLSEPFRLLGDEANDD